MGQLLDFMVAFHIHRKIGPVIVRDAVLIAFNVKNALGSVQYIFSNRGRIGPSGTVGEVQGNAETVTELVIANQGKVVGFVVIA